jgi:retron-type reverse transcriptase
LFSRGPEPTGDGRSSVDKAKPFDIPKREVWEAFKKVKANQGAAGVDGQSVAAFEAELSDNLYKLWNRMSSGSYFPPPVRRVMIPKPGGSGERPLGIPTVADRVAQEVVKRYLEPSWSPSSIRIPMGIAQAGRPSTQSGQRVSGAGVTTGCSISTSRATSTASIGVCYSRRFDLIRAVLG